MGIEISKVAGARDRVLIVDYSDGTSYLIDKYGDQPPYVTKTSVAVGDLSDDTVVFEAPQPVQEHKVGNVIDQYGSVDFGDKTALILYDDNSFGWTSLSVFGSGRTIVAIEDVPADRTTTVKTVIAFLRGRNND
jgi:hypothetical protein